MRGFRRASLFLVIALSVRALLAAPGHWSPAGPPGRVTALAVDVQGRVFAVTATGLWRSENHAETWQLVDARLTADVVRAIAGDPVLHGKVMAVGCGAYTTEDGGETWVPMPELTSDCALETLQVDRTRPQGFFTSGAAGLYRTGFGPAGQTWFPLGRRFLERTFAAAEPNFSGRIFAAPASGGLFTSRDSGATWTRSAGDPPGGPIREIQFSGGLVAATDRGVFATFDGPEWQDISGVLSGSAVFSLSLPSTLNVPATNRVAYAATSTGAYRANTFAVGWQRFSDGLPAGGVRKVVAAEDGRFAYAISESGEEVFAYGYAFPRLSFDRAPAVLSSLGVSVLRVGVDPPQPVRFLIEVEVSDTIAATSPSAVEPLAPEAEVRLVPLRTGAGSLTVRLPPEVGGGILEIPFRIENPRPVIGGLIPRRASAGSAGLTLAVSDSFREETFSRDAVVLWNGSPRPTRFAPIGACPGFCPPGVLLAELTAEDLSSPGTAAVSVINPAPGGGAADPFPFRIEAPAPRVVVPPCRGCSHSAREVPPRGEPPRPGKSRGAPGAP